MEPQQITEQLSEFFKNEDKHRYCLNLPNIWEMEKDTHPDYVKQFKQAAQQKGITMYEAFTEDVKLRVERFLETQGLKVNVTRHYHEDRCQVSLIFNSHARIPDFKKSLKTIFADLPLSEEATKTNVGAEIGVIWDPPRDPNDIDWDWC